MPYMTPQCGQPNCGAYHLTVREFLWLSGHRKEDHGLKVRLGLHVRKLYEATFGKPPKPHRKNANRNTLRKWPCGLLEQAYRELAGSPSFSARYR